MKPHTSEASADSPSAKAAIISLGCPKNQVDSEVMAGCLREAGFNFTATPKEAEVIIVNTCAFIAPAVEEAKQCLREMASLKNKGNCRLLICAGCLPQREGPALAAEFAEVDAFIGIDQIPRMGEIVGQLLSGEAVPPKRISLPTYLYDDTSPRLLSTSPWTAYVKIAEGCLHGCSFCTIPAIRGRFRSRQPDSIIKEARTLASRGVKEIVLIAQDTTAYGRDLGAALPFLLEALAGIDGLRWIRLMYAFPGEITEELLEMIASSDRICRYLDIPLQHSHPRILGLMRRPGSGDEYFEMITRIRSVLPDVALRSTFIAGFPGEGEREFEDLLDFIREAKLERVGAFPYYREDGTPAARMNDQVPPEIAQERYERLMLAQQTVCRQRNLAWVGRRMEVLVERVGRREIRGRSFRDAPEIDGEVILDKPSGVLGVSPGDYVPAEITDSSEYDLFGRMIDRKDKLARGNLSRGRRKR